MDAFEAGSDTAYISAQESDVSQIPLEHIQPQKMDGRQHLSHGGFDRMRMIDILVGIASRSPLPPVPIVERPEGAYRYRLCNGTHRFYASVAAGFSHLPTVAGWIPETEV